MFITILESVVGVCAVLAGVTISISQILRLYQEHRDKRR